jgi:ABC transporter DrrB family efflux protein
MAERHGGPLVQLTLWRVREFLREPEAVFWVFAFPVLLALALGLAFTNRGPQAITVGVVEGTADWVEVERVLGEADGIRAEALSADEGARRLRTGRIALLVTPGEPITFTFDETREESGLARMLVNNALQEAGGRHDVREVREVRVTEKGSRYIDFLIPGLLGLNIMGTGLWGIGFGLVRTRKNGLLKRLLASPMPKSQLLLSQILARLVFLVLEVAAVVLFGIFVFGVPFRGGLLAFLAVVFIGATAFSGLGLLVAARARTIEGVSGLMNLVMVPMWIFSGVFFAWANFPDAMHPYIQMLPLTALNDALRAVMLDGTGLVGILGWVGILAAWGVASFAAALRLFRWS